MKYLNLSLLIAFPVSWAAPLMRAGLLPFFGLNEISILSGLESLWDSDRVLALLVGFFAIAAPYAKTLMLAGMQFGYLTARWLPAIRLLGRLAMADIFLIALYIVVAKGMGPGRVETAWGLWLFTACALTSLAIAYLTPARR